MFDFVLLLGSTSLTVTLPCNCFQLSEHPRPIGHFPQHCPKADMQWLIVIAENERGICPPCSASCHFHLCKAIALSALTCRSEELKLEQIADMLDAMGVRRVSYFHTHSS